MTLFQSLATNRVELVRMDDFQHGLAWLLRSYNHRYNNELKKRVPRTIDVFDIHDGLAAKSLMIRFDYKEVLAAKPQPTLE
jgi:hypothetical protein